MDTVIQRILKQEISIDRPVFFMTQPIQEILDVQWQNEKLVMWYTVNGMPQVEKEYVVYGYYTGEYMPRFENSQYIKTIQADEYVYHLFIAAIENFDEETFMTDQEYRVTEKKYSDFLNKAKLS